MTRYPYTLILLCLCLLMVVPVSADTYITNFSFVTASDARTFYNGAGLTFPNLRIAAGTGFSATDAANALYVGSGSSGYETLQRYIACANTSTLPDTVVIDNATYNFIGKESKANGCGTINATMTGANVLNPAAIAAADHKNVTDAVYSNTILYADWSDTGLNTFTWNAAGLNNISKTGYTCFAVRNDWDVTGSNGSWVPSAFSALRIADTSDAAADPYFRVGYHDPAAGTGTATLYRWKWDNSTRIVPTSTIDVPTGTNLNLTATSGSFEPTSFIIHATSALTGVNVTPNATFNDGSGHSFTLSAIDIKTVKAWYQCHDASDENDVSCEVKVLIPELLLNDDGLVNANTTSGVNELKYSNATKPLGYYNISNPSDHIPDDAVFNDTPILLPFNVTNGENKQMWVTVNPPAGQEPGTYSGNLSITDSTGGYIGNMTLNVNVPNLTLQNPPLDYSIYYYGNLDDPVAGIDHVHRTPATLALDLTNIKNHGISYPTFYTIAENVTAVNLTAQIWNTTGFPTDKLFWMEYLIVDQTWDAAANASLLAHVNNVRKAVSPYGAPTIYAYGIDEPTDEQALGMRAPFELLRANGYKSYVADYTANGVLTELGGYLDTENFGGTFNTSYVNLWHAYGSKVYAYNQPQASIENATIYRYNYGYKLYNASYDGMMGFAYQMGYPEGYGYIWNDFDTGALRDHGIAYPTTAGPINTVQFESIREAVDDVRYVSTLNYITGSTTQSTGIIRGGLSAGNTSQSIREQLADAILGYGGAVIPTASFTKNATIGLQPAAIQFNDTSTNTPTMWNWSFGDGNWSNGTTQNVTHTYDFVGTFNASLIASNAAGSNQSANQSIEVTSGISIPVASFTKNRPVVVIPQLVWINDTSTYTPTMWNLSWGDGSWSNTSTASEKNASHTYRRPALMTITLNVSNAAGYSESSTRIWATAVRW